LGESSQTLPNRRIGVSKSHAGFEFPYPRPSSDPLRTQFEKKKKATNGRDDGAEEQHALHALALLEQHEQPPDAQVDRADRTDDERDPAGKRDRPDAPRAPRPHGQDVGRQREQLEDDQVRERLLVDHEARDMNGKSVTLSTSHVAAHDVAIRQPLEPPGGCTVASSRSSAATGWAPSR